jgi:S-adenosylhomocysteine hydrolase
LVEQTTRGHRFLNSPKGVETLRDLEIGAVSVALTQTKRRFEAPFIGMAIARSVVNALEKRHTVPRHGLVIGFGSVGSATAFALRSTYSSTTIDVVEIDPIKLDRARTMGFGVAKSLCGLGLGHAYDLVMGCTGHRTFRPSDRGFLADDALLASGSSAAVEFDRRNFVDQAGARKDDDFAVLTKRERELPLHTDIVFSHGPAGKRFTILNAGFPLNFQGSLGVIPTELIEPTHCLLHAATVEVMGSSGAGPASLSQKWDGRIHELASMCQKNLH